MGNQLHLILFYFILFHFKASAHIHGIKYPASEYVGEA